MLRMKELGLDKNINWLQGDLELLQPTPPAPFEKGFDLITATGVLHHLKNPVIGWRNLVDWLKPGGIMSLGLYSRLARIPCAQLRGEVAEKMEFSPPLFGKLPGTNFASMIRQPTPDELRRIRKHVLSQPQYATLAKKSMGEFKDMLCHPQERIFSLPEIGSILDNLGLEFVGLMLDDDATIRQEFQERFPKDKDMDDLLNWDAYEQEKPWTFSGMYLFHCRKIDKTKPKDTHHQSTSPTTGADNDEEYGEEEDDENNKDGDDEFDDEDDSEDGERNYDENEKDQEIEADYKEVERDRKNNPNYFPGHDKYK